MAAKLIAYTSAISSSIGSEFLHHSSTMAGIEASEEKSLEISMDGGTEFKRLGTMETSYCYLKIHGRSQ